MFLETGTERKGREYSVRERERITVGDQNQKQKKVVHNPIIRTGFGLGGMMESKGGGAGPTSSDKSSDSAPPRKNANRPKYSKFARQELPACKPILTPQWVISTFTLVSIIFIPIGFACLLASHNVVEIIDRYDAECLPDNLRDDKIAFIQNPKLDKMCKRTLKVPKHMKQPIYIYYQLDNFYQNHRRYVKSRNDMQLRDAAKINDTRYCDPEDTTSDKTPIVPCGLIAWSLFNDTYTFTRNNKPLTVNKKGISWKSDRDHKFGSNVYPKNFQSGPLVGGGKLDPRKPLSEQEDLIVWMRTAALPTFRKLYGKIEEDLQANETITVTLENNYNTYSFSGKKKLVLSTANWLGGKNDFLGIAYLTIGGLCFFLATAFTVVYIVKPRKLGDPSYLRGPEHPRDIDCFKSFGRKSSLLSEDNLLENENALVVVNCNWLIVHSFSFEYIKRIFLCILI